jgi:hypothetical protein
MPERRVVRRLLLLLLFFVGLFPVAFFSIVELGLAESTSNADSAGVETPGNIDRFVENDAFGVGEKLTFDIRYGFISAGTATMEVARLIEFEGRPCYQLVTRANSNGFFSTFYKVDDRVESILDATGIYSWRFEKNLREGNYRSDRLCMFDQRNGQVTDTKDTASVPLFVQDALSTLFYIRTQPLEVGKSVWLDNYVDGKQYRMEVKIEGRETVTVAAGTFDCLVVEPITQSVGIFKHEGRLKVWLTDDRLRMPVLMKSKIVVGSITAELTDYQLGQIEEF